MTETLAATGSAATSDVNAGARAMPIAPEDALRADLYDLLSSLLRRAPDAAMMGALADLRGDETDLGRAVDALSHIAGRTTPATAAREYHDLFVGIGRGELVPYGSYYLTGFLHEKPLGELRRDMARLGIVRTPGLREPEDHVAALLEMMSGMIRGTLAGKADVGLARQRAFFERHIGSWAPHFFRDLEAAQSAILYAPVGTVGRAMMNVEAAAFAMD